VVESRYTYVSVYTGGCLHAVREQQRERTQPTSLTSP